jgi:PAS domain S-box-containing protein
LSANHAWRSALPEPPVPNGHVGVALMRPADGTIVHVNETWERMFGYAAGELLGTHISRVSAATDETPEHRAREILAALDRDGVWSGELHSVRKDGSLFWTQCDVSRFEHAEHGTVWISLNRDITARRTAADTAHAALDRFRTVFERCPVGMALVDADLRVVDANLALCGLTGYRHDELVGMTAAHLSHPGDVAEVTTFAEQLFAGDRSYGRIRKRCLSKTLAPVPVALSMTVVREAGGRPLYGIAVLDPVSGDPAP